METSLTWTVVDLKNAFCALINKILKVEEDLLAALDHCSIKAECVVCWKVLGHIRFCFYFIYFLIPLGFNPFGINTDFHQDLSTWYLFYPRDYCKKVLSHKLQKNNIFSHLLLIISNHVYVSVLFAEGLKYLWLIILPPPQRFSPTNTGFWSWYLIDIWDFNNVLVYAIQLLQSFL